MMRDLYLSLSMRYLLGTNVMFYNKSMVGDQIRKSRQLRFEVSESSVVSCRDE
jgi:hypothetical protein